MSEPLIKYRNAYKKAKKGKDSITTKDVERAKKIVTSKIKISRR
jgi:hypothetical protein